MSDIDTTLGHIDEFIDVNSGDHRALLADVIYDCIEGAKRGYVDGELEDQALVDKIDRAEAELKRLGQSTHQDLEMLKREFREAAIESMTCRRTVLPLSPEGRPWITLDPRKTLFDNDDHYSFAIYDSLSDNIIKLRADMEQKQQEDANGNVRTTGPTGADDVCRQEADV